MRWIKVLLICSLYLSNLAYASPTCHGKFLNPITDVCWKCLFPLSIAGGRVADPQKDNSTPDETSSFFCHCKERIGIPIGFWEPFRVAEVTYKPFCMVHLNGLHLNLNIKSPEGTVSVKHGGTSGRKTAFYHVHWYVYPLLIWMNLITDLACMTPEEFDIAYMTEFDPMWNDDDLSMWLNPEVALFANPVAQVACASDCAAASSRRPINSLFWCAGCQGGIYPLTGTLGFYTSGVDASTLLVEKLIFKLHREYLLWGTLGKKGACGQYPMPWWRKDQYRLQMTYPRVEPNSKLACNPIGRTTFIWGANKEYPIKGEDFGYLIWRRRDCCAI